MRENEEKREIERKEKEIMREWKKKLQKKRYEKRKEKGGERDRGGACTHARRQRDVLIVRCILTVYRHSDRNIIKLIDLEKKAVYV